MRTNLLRFGLILAGLTLALAACSAGQPSPTADPTPAPTVAPTAVPTVPPTAVPTKVPPTAVPPTATPETGLHVVNFTSYSDSNGDFHVTGEIKNSDKRILSEMELTVVIKDASGKSLLKDKNDKVTDSVTFSPMLSDLAPGETSPFDYFLDGSTGKPDPKSVSVTVTGQHTSDITRASVEIQHAQMVASGSDKYLVSGEIVNKSDKPVEVHDLAAALVDVNGKVLSADYSVNYTISLLPAGNADKRDSSPFYLSVNAPETKPADFKTYLDVQEVEQPDTYKVQIEIANNYFDDQGIFHIVGTVTNKSSETLTLQIVAGLYDKDGIVLDAYSTSSPVNAAPGEVMPFDISSFDNVNNNPDEANRLNHFTVQVDDYFTFPSAIETVALKSSGDKAAKDATAAQWTITGKVSNTTTKALSSEIVMAEVFDAKGKLVAVNYEWITPSGDSLAPGDVSSFKVVVPLEPGIDTTGYTFKTLAKGEVK